MLGALVSELKKRNISAEVIVEVCDSTNALARELWRTRKTKRDLIVAAPYQTDGRGRFERKFKSDLGGAYFSVVTKSGDFDSENVTRAVLIAGLAVAKTLADYGLKPIIKWPNDILVSGKKICGILLEGIYIGNKRQAIIAGIGINVLNPVAPELKDIMTTLKNEFTDTHAPCVVIADVVAEFLSLLKRHENMGFDGFKDELKVYGLEETK